MALEEVNKKVYLASKTQADNEEDALKDVERSLANLRVDKIDIYQLHAVNNNEQLEEKTGPGSALEGLKEAKRDGKIENIGITGHQDETLLKGLKTDEFDTVLFCYNFIENECEEELIDYARSKDIGMIAMKPMAGGRLKNAKIALKYIFNQDKVVPIPGMETVREVEENIQIAKSYRKITEEEEKIMSRRRDELGTQFCRRCGYCSPCPQDISIPMVLRAESFINRFPPETINERYVEEFQKAHNCVECEECVEKCPYNLPIPELIKENREVMDKYLSSIEKK